MKVKIVQPENVRYMLPREFDNEQEAQKYLTMMTTRYEWLAEQKEKGGVTPMLMTLRQLKEAAENFKNMKIVPVEVV